MIKQKKIILYAFIVLFVGLASWGLSKLYAKATRFAVNYIAKQIQSQTGNMEKYGQLKWDKVSISLIPLKVKMTNVVFTPANKILLPQPLQVQTLTAEPDYLALLNRALSAKITLIKPNITVKRFSTNGKKGRRSALSQTFQISDLKNFPVSYFALKDANMTFIAGTKMLLVKNWSGGVRLNPAKITVQAEAPFMEIGGRPAFSSSIDVTIRPDVVYLTRLNIENQTSRLKVSGLAEGKIESQIIRYGKIKVEGAFLTQDLNAIASIIHPRFQNPFEGKITLNSEIKYSKPFLINGHIDLLAKEFSAGNVFLSQVKVKGVIQDNLLSFTRARINSTDKWHIDLQKSKLQLKKPYRFQSEVLVNNSRLNELFKTFNLHNIPVSALMNGKWKCGGMLLPPVPSFKCAGNAHFNGFAVYGGKEGNVLDISKLTVKNQVSFKDSVLTIKKEIQPGFDSLIFMESVLNKDGKFFSQYKGMVNFSDIKNLVQIEPQGTADITEGSININGKKFDIKATIRAKDLSLGGFHLGNVGTVLSCTEKEFLHFRKIQGRVLRSRYTGNVGINIPKNTIQAFVHFPYITLENLKYILKDRVHFPFDISGAGTANGYLNSSLKLNALSYNLQAQLFKIKWEKESFNRVDIQVESKNGHVKTQKAELLKNNGRIVFQGEVDPKGNMKAKLTGKGLYLQESENISRITGPETTGIMDFDMNLNGYFLDPLVTTKLKIKKSFFKGYPTADSHIDLNLRKHQIEAKGSVADKLNIQKLIIPFQKDGTVFLQADTHDMNIKEVFLSKGESTQLYNQFESGISGMINVSYKKDQPLGSAKGYIKINDLTLNANGYKLTNSNPFLINLKKGLITIDPVSLKTRGGRSLNIMQNEKGMININGDSRLDFFIFLFPFMRIWEGDLAVDLNLKPELSNLWPKGKIQVQNGFVRLNPGMDSFEEILANIQVRDNKLLFPSLRAKMGGGSLQVAGEVVFLAGGDVPVNVKGSFSRVQFTSLPGIHARGSGQVFLTGKNFPYTLGMTANIEDAKIEKEFISTEGNEVRRSPRLFLLEEDKKNFEPLNMRLNLYLKQAIQVENSTMKSAFTGRIKITGSPLNPLLSGRLNALPGGMIVFRENEFEILSSQISYFNDKPSNPVINLRAKTFIREEKASKGLAREEKDSKDFANEYNILLRVKGRGSAPVFKLTSTPALTENEIASLLAFGVRSVTFEPGSTMNNIAKYSYYHLGPVLFQKAIGRELKDTLGVDQFLIVPHISSKDNSTSTKLIVRKKMFNRLNLSASQTILKKKPESDIKAEYEINKNVSVIGMWQNEEPDERSDVESNVIGLDLEYQVDF